MKVRRGHLSRGLRGEGWRGGGEVRKLVLSRDDGPGEVGVDRHGALRGGRQAGMGRC